MNNYTPDRVINGTFGEVWCDNEYVAEVTGLEASVKFDTQDVKMVRTLWKGHKVTGASGSGTLKMNKVTSAFLKKGLENAKAGKGTRVVIITKLDDPEAFGTERVTLQDCLFTELKVADWENGKLCEENLPFVFGKCPELIEAINAE